MNKSLVGRVLAIWVLIAGLTPPPAHAQLSKVTGFYTPANQVPVTAELVDRFIKGLRAEYAERDRIAAASNTDPNVVTYFRLYARRAKCDSIEKSFDAEQARLTKQMQTATTGEQLQATVQRMQKFMADRQSFNRQTCEGAKPEMVQSFFDNLRVAEASMDNVGATAAGLSRGQYAYLRERIVALVLMGGAMHDKIVGYAPGEVAAIRARNSVLIPLVSRDFNGNGERKPTGDI